MNYFFVFQNKSFNEERKGGYLWAPQRNKSGMTFHHWTEMTNVRKGDIVFNSFNSKMVSVIVAKEDYKTHEKPVELDQLENWEKDGWIVNAEYYDLEQPFVYKEYIEEIFKLQGDIYAPFNVLRRGNTGYLFRVTEELANYLFTKIRDKNEKVNELLDKLGIHSTVMKTIEEDIDSEQSEEDRYYNDGASTFYYGKRYERNPKNRAKAIQHHGLDCAVCEFNFEKEYGQRGTDFIEVHHVNQLSTLNEEVLINPVVDLVPVCANCHRMIHRKKDHVLTINELKEIINRLK